MFTQKSGKTNLSAPLLNKSDQQTEEIQSSLKKAKQNKRDLKIQRYKLRPSSSLQPQQKQTQQFPSASSTQKNFYRAKSIEPINQNDTFGADKMKDNYNKKVIPLNNVKFPIKKEKNNFNTLNLTNKPKPPLHKKANDQIEEEIYRQTYSYGQGHSIKKILNRGGSGIP